jgi:hypothetical protein
MVHFIAGLNRFQNYLTSNGLESSDIPKAFVLHEVLGICMLAITWTFCYHFPLSNIPFFATQLKKLPSMHSYSKSKAMTGVINAFSSKKGVAYLESSCLRKIIRPFTIPGKMWVVFVILKSLKAEDKLLADEEYAVIPAINDNSVRNICWNTQPGYKRKYSQYIF